MATRLQAIEALVMRLGPKSRAKLAERLILSLDTPMEAELESLWAEEAERRVDELRKGLVTERPASMVLRTIRRQISRRKSGSTR